MNFDGYMNPMFSDMDNKYIYPMPYVNPMVYMNPYMVNPMPSKNNKQQSNNENQNEQYSNPYQNNPMMYMNPYMMNPMMGGMDPSLMMQMCMQMMQMMQMMGGANQFNPMPSMNMDNHMQDNIPNPCMDSMKPMNGMPMMGCMPGMGYMPGMPNINIEEFDEEEM